MVLEYYCSYKIHLPSTKSERISGVVKFFPHHLLIPQNTILEESLEAANKLATTLASDKLLPLFKDKNDTSEALKSLSDIFLRRLNTLASTKSQQASSPTLALRPRVLSKAITTTAPRVSTFSPSIKASSPTIALRLRVFSKASSTAAPRVKIFSPSIKRETFSHTSAVIPPDSSDFSESPRDSRARI